MTSIVEGVATNIAQRLVDKTIQEVSYFRDFEDHVHNFAIENNSLLAKRNKVEKEIEDARRNENQIEDEVQHWIVEADIIIQKNTKIKQTWSYRWCPYWQYQQAKRLAKRALAVRDHMQKWNFDIVARPAELPGIKYHASSKDFIDFENRKKKFKELVEALENGNHYIIGLQGMGGTGKTTMATQVGKKIEESKAFEKVIFVVVSNPPDVNKIRGDIARQLGLKLEERVEADHSQLLWSRIYKNEKKLLIILDDVWEELSLTDIGIPSGLDHKNCYVLITTRHSKVCQAMRCQQIVHLHTLDDDDALRLFSFHARSNGDDSSSIELNGLARDFLKECGGLPVAIVALASTLKNWHVGELNAALAALQKSKSFVDVNEDLVEVYSCLRLSYDNLHNEKAQKLFLLCSIFPEDFEFPVNLIIRLGMGSGIFDDVGEYCAARSQALTLKNKLIDSSLLLKVGEKECVKMHDLVREVAQWIAKEDIQIIMDSRTPLKAEKRLVFCSTGEFPYQFDGKNLDILLLWINGNITMKDPNALFAGMSRLKILFLRSEYGRNNVPTPSISQSLLSLKSIHTLILDGWEIGDISILKNLKSLVTLEFKNSLIIELPIDIMELKKLRWLGLRKCEIQKNNPFEVIERCSQLEDVYFVGNHNVDDWNQGDDKEIKDEIGHDISPALQMFCIACDDFKCFANDDNGLLKCFNPGHMKHLISEAMFKYLVGSTQVLELGKIGQTGWKSLVPDIIPMEDGAMNNLIKLYLYEWADIEYLVDNSKYHPNIMVFSKLVELHMYNVDVKRLYWGVMPSCFLTQLQILKLNKCMELQNIFLHENLKLPHLKVLELIDCPMFQPSIFQPSCARNLVRLEELVIKGCNDLQSLFAYETLEEETVVVDDIQKNYGLLFPELKSLKIEECGKLEMVSPLLLAGDLPRLKELYIKNCKELRYIFGDYRDVGQVFQQKIMLPLLIELELDEVPSFINIIQKSMTCIPRPVQVLKKDPMDKYRKSKASAFSWALGCCLWAPTKDNNATQEYHTISQESCASLCEMIETFHTSECLMRQPLSLQHIRRMRLEGCSKLKSLFSVSIATTIMLEQLEIRNCEELKHIITNEVKDGDHLNCTSIFQKLQCLQVFSCPNLEFIFPSNLYGGLLKLKYIDINGAYKLKYVFGKYNEGECVSNENENDDPHIHLPALETLSLGSVQNMMSIVINKYQQKCPSLHTVEVTKEIKKQMQDVTNERAKGSEIHEIVNNVEKLSTSSVDLQYFLYSHNLKEIQINRNQKLKTLFSISTCRNLPQLSKLDIQDCEELVNVVEDYSNDPHHMNYSSMFPKLEYLSIWNSDKLEFIFPFSLLGSLQKLKYLFIRQAVELKYIFGKHDDESHIHLPALETLIFIDVPMLFNNIFAKKYHLSFPSLQSIILDNLEELNGRSFSDLMAYLQGTQLNVETPKELIKIIKGVQKLTKLDIRYSNIEEVLNLEGVEIEGPVMTLRLEEMRMYNLNELRHIWKGPKNILSLHNLCQLTIIACKKLRSIFNVSIVTRLPQLSHLSVEDCDELIEITEEDDEDHSHQLCFPKLMEIIVKNCKRLKCLFSISTHAMLPKLKWLIIADAPELEKVFIRKKDDTRNMVVKDVFPMLSELTLRRLPMLVDICEGIDFQTFQNLAVFICPKYEEVSSRLKGGPSNLDPKNKEAAEEQLSLNCNNAQCMPHMGETSGSSSIAETTEETLMEIQAKDLTPGLEKQASETSAAKSQLKWTSLHSYKETEKGVGRAITDPTSKLMATTSFTFRELEDEHATYEATLLGQPKEVGETKTSIEVPHKTKTPFHDDSIDVMVKEKKRFQGSATSKDILLETMLTDLAPSNFSAASTTTLQEDFPPSNGSIQEDITAMKVETDTSFIYLQEEDSQSGPSTLSIKDTMEQGLEDNYAEDDLVIAVQSTNSDSRKQSAGPIDKLSGKDSALGAKEIPKDIDEKPTVTKTSPMAISLKRALITKKTTDQSSIQEEAESEKPIKAILPQVIPSLHHQSQIADASSSSPKLGICEIFRLVDLKHGETALLAQALEQYPQLVLPREHRTHRIIAWSYRVLVDILVILSTKTPNNITPSEKSTLEANLSEAIVLGFDKEWVESVRSKVLGVDVSYVLAAKEEIEVMEMKLGEIDSQLLGLSEDRKKVIQSMAMFRDIISAKDKPFGI